MKKELEPHLEDRIQITEKVLKIFNIILYFHSAKKGHKTQSGLSRVMHMGCKVLHKWEHTFLSATVV